MKNLSNVLFGLFSGLLLLGVAHASPMPEPMLDELAPLIDSSSKEAIDPGVYQVAKAYPENAHDIACILVKFFGQADEVEENMLAVVSEEGQKEAVKNSVANCRSSGEADYVGRYSTVKNTFNHGVTQGQ